MLVVDDVADNIKLLVYNLEDEGYRVLEATSGIEAMHTVDMEAPDIILLDVMMPDVSGLEVLKELKSSQDTAHIPVILVTTNSLDEQIVQGLDLGAYDYVIRPYSYTVLAARIRAALRGKAHQEQLKQLSATDSLTQLLNKRQFTQMVQREIQRVYRLGGPLCLIVLDIDHFKSINEHFGHDTGDEVLLEFSRLISQQVRTIDIIARFAGDEFVICLPDTDLPSALNIAERILCQVEQSQVLSKSGNPIDFTASIGVSTLKNDEHFEVLYTQADKALYKAKHSGRNQVAY